MKSTIGAVAVILALSLPALLAQEPKAGTPTDPILGTWSLDLEQSTFQPGPAPAPGTISVRRYRLTADGFMTSVFATIDPEGNPSFLQATWKYDGQDYPIFAADSLIDYAVTGAMPGTMAYRSVDAHTTEMTPKDSTGKAAFTGIRRRAVSRDGKTLIDISRGTNARGEEVDNVLVFTRCAGPCLVLDVP